jgi:hypothetical protein
VHTHHALVGALVALDDGDLPLQDDDEVVAQVALAVEHLTGRGAPALALSEEGEDLTLAQQRECAVEVDSLLERF